MFENMINKVVLVTGGSRGIGYEIVCLLANYGLNVAFTYCNNEIDLGELEGKLNSNHGVIRQYKLDISDYSKIDGVLLSIEKDFGTIHYLVNCAGIIADSYFMLMDHDKWNRVINTDLSGTFYITQKVLPMMFANDFGSIVNISSISGLIATVGQANYCAAKAGMIAMTKVLAKEVAQKNIRVNAIAPGFILTDMTSDLISKKRSIVENIPMHRVGEPKEVANAVLYLLSDGASYITGNTLILDGGMLA